MLALPGRKRTGAPLTAPSRKKSKQLPQREKKNVNVLLREKAFATRPTVSVESKSTVLHRQKPATPRGSVEKLPPEKEVGGPQLRRSKRAKRRARHKGAAAAAKAAGASLLEVNAVRPSTAERYAETFAVFKEWVTLNKLALHTAAEVDEALCEYLEHLYFEGHAVSQARNLIAAVKYFKTQLKILEPLELPRTKSAVRGFQRLSPGLSRAPLPWVAVCALVGASLFLGEMDYAMLLVIQFVCYLRPSEVLGLLGSEMFEAVPGSGVTGWALLLFPSEGEIPGKTGMFDESVMFDPPWLTSILGALRLLKKRARDGPVFKFSYPQYLQMFHRLCELSGVNVLKAHPYSLRHGGASTDRLLKTRPLKEVKKRGRWRADASVARYEKHSRLLKEVERLPKATRDYGSLLNDRMADALSSRWQPPAPPFSERGGLLRAGKKR